MLLTSKKIISLLTLVFLAAYASAAYSMQSTEQINTALKNAYDKYKDLQEGANADYIPALAKVDPNLARRGKPRI